MRLVQQLAHHRPNHGHLRFARRQPSRRGLPPVRFGPQRLRRRLVLRAPRRGFALPALPRFPLLAPVPRALAGARPCRVRRPARAAFLPRRPLSRSPFGRGRRSVVEVARLLVRLLALVRLRPRVPLPLPFGQGHLPFPVRNVFAQSGTDQTARRFPVQPVAFLLAHRLESLPAALPRAPLTPRGRWWSPAWRRWRGAESRGVRGSGLVVFVALAVRCGRTR